MQILRLLTINLVILLSFNVSADEAKNWLKTEIDKIIYAYQDNNLPNENRFLMIEQTINNNFAGSGIAKFVAGKSWNGATKDTKIEYIKLAKKIGESSKVSIRNIRRDGIERYKKLEKDKEIGEDDSKKLQSDIESLTSDHIKMIDSIVSEKEADLSKV